MPPKRHPTSQHRQQGPVKRVQPLGRPITRKNNSQPLQIPTDNPERLMPRRQTSGQPQPTPSNDSTEVTSLKQLQDEPITTYTMRLLQHFNDRDITEQSKMEIFKKNLLPALQFEVELENSRKAFATLTGMACYADQTFQTMAKAARVTNLSDRAESRQSDSVDQTVEANIVIEDMVKENEQLRQRLTQVQVTEKQPENINKLDTSSG